VDKGQDHSVHGCQRSTSFCSKGSWILGVWRVSRWVRLSDSQPPRIIRSIACASHWISGCSGRTKLALNIASFCNAYPTPMVVAVREAVNCYYLLNCMIAATALAEWQHPHWVVYAFLHVPQEIMLRCDASDWVMTDDSADLFVDWTWCFHYDYSLALTKWTKTVQNRPRDFSFCRYGWWSRWVQRHVG